MSESPALYRALVDAHLAGVREQSVGMAEELGQQAEDLAKRFATMTEALIVQAYAEGVRDGYAQGVAVNARRKADG